MDPNSVDGSISYYSDSGGDMEDTHSLQEDEETEECLEYRGKPYKNLMLDDLRDVEFNTIEEVDQFYA